MFVFVGGESHNNSLITIHSRATPAGKEVVTITDKEEILAMWNWANGIFWRCFTEATRNERGNSAVCNA